ncbi:MAG TPA: type III restriction endonuclease subunit R, partial [Candidatus Tectomicrobia bacterium]
QWEQSAAYVIDTHELVEAFVKNAGLGFAIPYLHNGEPHDYVPDFIIRLRGEPTRHVILETKGFDPLMEVKQQAAMRWVDAVNADGSYGRWDYAMARKPEEVRTRLEETAYLELE